MNQSINQPTNQSINQSINNQSRKQASNESTKLPTNQSNTSICLSFNQPIIYIMRFRLSICVPGDHSNLSVSQSCPCICQPGAKNAQRTAPPTTTQSTARRNWHSVLQNAAPATKFSVRPSRIMRLPRKWHSMFQSAVRGTNLRRNKTCSTHTKSNSDKFATRVQNSHEPVAAES